jgi:hypothetical protein
MSTIHEVDPESHHPLMDDYVSFFLTAESRYPTTPGWIAQEHVMPYAIALERLWCCIGCSIGNPPNYGLDVAVDVIRKKDNFTLARWRDDHYTLPTGMPNTAESWIYSKPVPVLDAGDVVITNTYCFGNPSSPEWISAFIAVELIGRKL